MASPKNTLRSVSKPAPSPLEQLQTWMEKHRELFDVFMDAFCVVDSANHVIEFNEAFSELCGESYRRVLKVGNFCELLPTEFCPTACPARQIFESKQPLRLDEVGGSSRGYSILHMTITGVPILSEKGEALGSLLTLRNVSAENELQKKYDERKKESVTDGLTGLFNKIYTENALRTMMKGSTREMKGISVIMCDIDHFKRINDTHGHQAGDHVLTQVAHALKEEMRETDLVGRVGGEEFLIIVNNSDRNGAKVVAEKLRERIATAMIVFDDKPIPVTISLGTASFSETFSRNLNWENATKDLINKADVSLYVAKANGRNQACQYENLPDTTLKNLLKTG